jgi:hypothetical protein
MEKLTFDFLRQRAPFAVRSPTQSTPTATSNHENHNELIEQGLSPARFLDSKMPTA